MCSKKQKSHRAVAVSTTTPAGLISKSPLPTDMNTEVENTQVFEKQQTPDSDFLTVHVEEFKVMHAQILERSKIRQQLLHVGTLLSVAVLGFFGSNIIKSDFFSNYSLSFCLFLLLVPFPFYALTVYYGHMDYMIGITARYIHVDLRPRVAKVLKSDDFWRNEDFFEKGREVRGLTITEWFGTFGMLLFIPTVLNVLSTLYLDEHWAQIPHSVRKPILVWSILNFSLFLISIKESFSGVDVLKRIRHSGNSMIWLL